MKNLQVVKRLIENLRTRSCSWVYRYVIVDENNEQVLHKNGYVPDCLAIEDSGYGDYIIIKVDENGLINNWKFNISDFIDDVE